MKLFPAFFDRPERMKFADQEEDENIELLLRQHFITNIPWILSAILLIFLPIIIFRLRIFFIDLGVLKTPPDIAVAVLILWYLFVTAFILTSLLHWYFNIYIVTNKHLVDIEFNNLLSRDKTEVRLDDVQSAKSGLHGIIGSLFKFGDVVIKTAADRQDITFMAVPYPDAVVERIQDLQEVQEGPRDVT